MTQSASFSGVLASVSDELAGAVQHAGRSVVAVHGRRRFPGSGLAWRPDLVVTAAHVLEREHDLSIGTPDGTQLEARLIGHDPGSDLAVLRIPGAALAPIEPSPTEPRPGHLVLAVGRPGTPEPIASFGAISSIGGTWRTALGGILEAYLRADVALLPGLSGGAIVDVGGRVLALLSAHLAGGDPVGIPVRVLEPLVERLLSGGSVRRAYLGISTQPVELQAGLRDGLAIEQRGGLMLLGLEPDAPADRAGLLPGDILLTIGDRAVEDGEALQMALGPQAVDTPTPVRLVRGGRLHELSVTPAPRPNA